MQSPDDLLDLRATCALIGGSRPINPATLYRSIRKGVYPKAQPLSTSCRQSTGTRPSQ